MVAICRKSAAVRMLRDASYRPISSSRTSIGNMMPPTNTVAIAAASTPGGPKSDFNIGSATNPVFVIDTAAASIPLFPTPSPMRFDKDHYRHKADHGTAAERSKKAPVKERVKRLIGDRQEDQGGIAT